MPTVTCPNCGERGKIPTKLIGARIKCTKCGVSFSVSPAVDKPGPASFAGAAASHEGIAVEGLEASAWSLSNEPGVTLQAEARPEEGHGDPIASSEPKFQGDPVEPRQYKILTARDKFFEGKFDLNRLEEALNHFARQGWTVKAMTLPHIKGFSGVIEETLVVLLER